MLGFAVVAAEGATTPVVVWLVSKVSSAEAASTNAVVFQPPDLSAPGGVARLRGMLADRYVILTEETSAEVVTTMLGGEVLPVVQLRELSQSVAADVAVARERFAAEKARRRAEKKSALVEPTWPAIPAGEPRHPAGTSDPLVRETLSTANRIVRVWSTWLALEALRSSRAYLGDPDAGPGEAALPVSFTTTHEVMPLQPPTR